LRRQSLLRRPKSPKGPRVRMPVLKNLALAKRRGERGKVVTLLRQRARSGKLLAVASATLTGRSNANSVNSAAGSGAIAVSNAPNARSAERGLNVQNAMSGNQRRLVRR